MKVFFYDQKTKISAQKPRKTKKKLTLELSSQISTSRGQTPGYYKTR